MPAERKKIKFGKVDSQDIIGMVVSRFQEGANIVFLERDNSHKIYILPELMATIGGYSTVNQLVQTTFNTVAQTDDTKTRFFFGESYRLGKTNLNVYGFEIIFPRLYGHQPLEETQGKFIQAVEDIIARKSV